MTISSVKKYPNQIYKLSKHEPYIHYKNDSVIANVRRGPLTFLEILAFKMRGNTNIDSNLSGIIIFDSFKYCQISLPY